MTDRLYWKCERCGHVFKASVTHCPFDQSRRPRQLDAVLRAEED